MSVSRSCDDPPAYCLHTSLETVRPHVTDLFATGVKPEINHAALTRYLLDWGSWGELFSNVRPLLPGAEVEVAAGHVRTTRRLPEPLTREWLDQPIDGLVEELRKRLLAAATWAAGNARVVGVLVGGIDSSGVLAALARVVPADRIRALSVTGEPGVGDTDPDLPYVEALCRHLGVKLVTDPWIADRHPVEEVLLTDSRPAFGPYHKFDKLLDGVDVMLTATAGDALFGGNFDELGARIPRAPLASIRTLCADVPWKTSTRERASWVAGRTWRQLPRPRRAPRFFGPRLRASRIVSTPSAPTPEGRIRDYYTSPIVQTAHLHTHALTQRFSIPYRDVVLHSELVRFLASVPIETLNCDQRYRGLYHRAIAPWVPAVIRERRTKSYWDPFVVLPPSTERFLRDLARATKLESFGYANGKALLAEMDRGNVNGIWKFLTVEAWLRAHA